jgi:hypothetical protein
MSREGSHPSKDSLAQLLRALIGYELPVEPVLAALRSFGWDAPEPVVLLTREDIVRILDRYLAGKLTTEQVTDWADLVECREDIGFPSGDEDAAGTFTPCIVSRSTISTLMRPSRPRATWQG